MSDDRLNPNAGPGDLAFSPVGRVPTRGAPDDAGPVPLPGAGHIHEPDAVSGDPAFNLEGRVPSRGAAADVGRVALPGDERLPGNKLPRRRRRLHRVWPDRDGNISYLLTLCVDGRVPVLNNELTFERVVTFLLDSPSRYHWFGRRFVIMPDHLHLIAHMGHDAVRLGQWIKAL